MRIKEYAAGVTHTATERGRERQGQTDRDTEKDTVITRRPEEISCSTMQEANAGKKSMPTDKHRTAQEEQTALSIR